MSAGHVGDWRGKGGLGGGGSLALVMSCKMVWREDCPVTACSMTSTTDRVDISAGPAPKVTCIGERALHDWA